MARYFKKRDKSFGNAPGSVVFIGVQKMDEPVFKLMTYNEFELHENIKVNPDKISASIETDKLNWFSLHGLHNTQLIEKIGKAFDLPTLLVEDIANTAQRPKIEQSDGLTFIALKIPTYSKDEKRVYSEQFSMIVKDNILITFQEDMKDVFAPVKERIRNSSLRIRLRGADYLAYALFDTIAENYAKIIEEIGEEIDGLERDIVNNPSDEVLIRINHYRQELNFVAKILLPVKDIMFKMTKQPESFVTPELMPFVTDLNDLIIHSIESIDAYRVILNDYFEVYNSIQSNKLNDIMRILTIFSAIFIPLTFLAGVYGTNFEYLPELKYKISYPIFWIIMVITALSMIWFFKRKKWL